MPFILLVSCCNIIVSDVDFPVMNNFNQNISQTKTSSSANCSKVSTAEDNVI